VNKKIFRSLTLAVSVCALSFVVVGQQQQRQQQQPARVRRSGGGGSLDNLSLPSTTTHVSAATASAGVWQMFAPEGAGFSVLLPGTPEESTRAGREQGTVNALFRGYRLAAGGVKYELTRTPPLPEQLTAHPDFQNKFFEELKGGMTEALQALNPRAKFRLAAHQAISLGGFEGREYEYAAAGHRAAVRVFLVNNSIYALTVLGPKSELSPETINRFLNSFAVTQ